MSDIEKSVGAVEKAAPIVAQSSPAVAPASMAAQGQANELSGSAGAERAKKRAAFVARTSGPAPETSPQIEESGENPVASAADSVSVGSASGAGGAKNAKLPSAIATKAAQAFSADFSDVVVRSGAKIDSACAKRGALAYTTGRMISMSSKAGAPNSPEYEETLMHELTHVVQQSGNAKGGNTAAAEGEARSGAKTAMSGGKVNVSEGVASGTKQNLDDAGGGAGGTGAENTTEVQIPLPGGTFIKVTPPVESGDWKIGVGGGLKVWEEPLEEKAEKFWHKNIPTPFFGLSLLLGAGLGFEFKAGGLALDSAELAYKASEDRYDLSGTIKTNFGWEFSANLAAGVAVDAWVAEAGVGLKAKLAIGKQTPLSASAGLYYSGKTGEWGGQIKLDMAALEIECKASVGLFVYYDAAFVSTYTKDWTLAERTLGKMTMGGVSLQGSLSNNGFDGKIEPKPFEMQGLDGNVRSMYPSKS